MLENSHNIPLLITLLFYQVDFNAIRIRKPIEFLFTKANHNCTIYILLVLFIHRVAFHCGLRFYSLVCFNVKETMQQILIAMTKVFNEGSIWKLQCTSNSEPTKPNKASRITNFHGDIPPTG